jgi:Uma2 family endonuclease
MALTQSALGLDGFLTLPEEKPALEFLEGRVSQKMSPKTRHSSLQSELTERINGFGRPRHIARAFPELRSTFAGASPVPDVVVLRWDHISYDEKGFLVDDLYQAPDIAIEIISPDQSANALIRRCLWYVANGVQIALLADPDDESVLAFRQGPELRALRGIDRIDLDVVLPEFDLTVEELFKSLRQPDR